MSRYNGFGVLRAAEDFGDLALVGMYQSPSKHIAYGADWWQGSLSTTTAGEASGNSGSAAKGRALAATCTFYDRLHTLVWMRTQ